MACLIIEGKYEDVPRELRYMVKTFCFQAAYDRFEVFEELLAKASLRVPSSNRTEIRDLYESICHPEWRNADNLLSSRVGIYDHFKGGIYLATGTSLFVSGEKEVEVVEYISLKSGKKCTRYLWQWNEVVRWPDGKFRSRFVYRGSDLSVPEPSFKVHA